MYPVLSRFSFALLLALLALSFAGCSLTDNGGTSLAPVPEGSTTITSIPEMVSVPKGTFKMGWDNLPVAAGMPNGTDTVAHDYPSTYFPSVTGPVRKVTLAQDFKIGKYEITNAQFCDMLNYALGKGYLVGNYAGNETVKNAEGNSQELLNLDADYEGRKCEIVFTGNRFEVKAGMEKRPVVYVTWYGAAFYCNMLGEYQGLTKLYNLADWTCTFGGTKRFYGFHGYRLPTEAEWEYVARYDPTDNLVYDRRLVPWLRLGFDYWVNSDYGRNYTYLNEYTSFMNGSGSVDVDTFEKGVNPLGVYHLGGNVSEWAQDFYASYTYFSDQYKSASYDPAIGEVNPINDTSGVYRQRRGGCWLIYGNNSTMTTYHTNTNWAYTNYCDLGFRPVEIQ